MDNYGEIIIYQTEDGLTKLDVRMEDETVWLTQQQMAELFQTSRTNVVDHIKNIYEREAYSWTVSTSIYVDRDYRRCGAGAMLYRVLEEELRKQGIINLLAGVAYNDEEDEYLSHDSYQFHIKEGYTEVAHIKSVGKKFDRWYDLLWFQKKI